MTLKHIEDPYLENLLHVVKKMRVKDTRKVFVSLRQQSEKGGAGLEQATDYLFANEGVTFGEFATAYILNNQCRDRKRPGCVQKQ
jgi:hypothetical protein